MSLPPSDALVFFGATGDLAYKKIFPALYAMARRGRLDIPVIGVARAGWSIEQLRARARESITKHVPDVDATHMNEVEQHLRLVGGNYEEAATYTALATELGNATQPDPLPRDPAEHVLDGRGRARAVGLRTQRARHRREAFRARSRLGAKLECDVARGVR